MNKASLFLILAIPRLLYIYVTDQSAGDTAFYNLVAHNILSGCGFSASASATECEPLVGGYFPAYFYFIALFNSLGFSNKAMAIFTGMAFVASTLYLYRVLARITKKQNLAMWIALVVGLSPLTFGFSRFILIEPIMSVFSVLILAQVLCLIAYKRARDWVFCLVLTAIATYFKPTSIIFIVPLCIAIIYAFGLKNSFKRLAISGLFLILVVLPWELRTLALKHESVLSMQSNAWPPVKHYHAWVKSWAITEYERADATFPLWRGELSQISIKPNYFLSQAEATEAMRLVGEHTREESIWTTSIDERFLEVVQKRLDSMTIFDRFALFLLQSASLLLHPGNSYGFPLSLSHNRQRLDHGLKINDLSTIDKLKSGGKGLIFVYRTFMILIVLWAFVWWIKSRTLKRDSSLVISTSQSNFHQKQIFEMCTVLSLTLLIAQLVFSVILTFGLEHRYLSVSFLWIEVAVCLFIFQIKLFSR
jgi:hypothetical protein